MGTRRAGAFAESGGRISRWQEKHTRFCALFGVPQCGQSII
jgi:hypothetical protein